MKCKSPLPFPCGKCLPCRLNYARDWAIRIMCEAKSYDEHCTFVTLTYDDEHLPENRSLVKKDLQLFFRYFRRFYGKVRYFACGEYGDKTKRPHYHICLFGKGVDADCWTDKFYYRSKHGYDVKTKAWSKGKVFIGEVTVYSANYVAGYMLKKQKGLNAVTEYDKTGRQRPFTLCSRRPGIGFNYAKAHIDELRERQKISFKGHLVPLSRYFWHQIFTDEERQELLAVKGAKAVLDFMSLSAEEKSATYKKLSPLSKEERKQLDSNIEAMLNLNRGVTEE